jgi:molecular chaperone HscA
VLRLINEPTAAAVAYGLDKRQRGRCMRCTTSAAAPSTSRILRLSRGVFEVVATGGDSALGGDDFDRRIGADGR